MISTTSIYKLTGRIASLLVLLAASLFAAAHLRLAWLYVQHDDFLDDDTRQHLTPFVAERHPGAFNDRLVLDYAAAYLPRGYHRVMSALSRHTDALTASKYLGFALMLATVTAALLAGGKLGGMPGAAVALIMALRSDMFAYHVYAGLFRSFGVPLAMLHFYLLFARRFRAAAVSLLAQALFYPPLCVINLPATVVVTALAHVRRHAWLRRGGLVFILVVTAAMAALHMYNLQRHQYGPPIRMAEAELMCEWHYEGRFPELPFQPTGPALREALLLGKQPGTRGTLLLPEITLPDFWRPHVLPAALLLLFLTALVWNPYATGVLTATATSGFLLYLLACRYAFRLGYPERYLHYALPFVVVLMWPAAWGAVRRRWPDRLTPRIGILLLGAAVWFAYPWRLPSLHDMAIHTGHNEPLYAAMRRTGPDALITAWTPNILDDIPLRAGREVFVNFENAHPLYMDYYRQIRTRILDTIELAFATNINQAVAIRDRHGLTHLILEHSLFDDYQRTPRFFAPLYHTGVIMRRRAPLDATLFNQPRPEWVWHSDDVYRVIDLRRLPDAPPAPEPTPELIEPWCRYPDDLDLINVRLVPGSMQPDGKFQLEYTWHAPIYMVYRPIIMFVHFMQDGQLVFTGDHPLFVSLDHASTAWQTQKPVMMTYRHKHRAPPGAAGSFEIRTGLFNRRTGRRLIPLDDGLHDHGAVTIPLELTIPVF